MKLAVFTVSLPEWTPEEAVHNLAELGYDGVEWRVTDDVVLDTPGFWRGNRCTVPLSGFVEDSPRVRKLTTDAGLEIAPVASYVQAEDRQNVECVLRGTAALGAPAARIQVSHYDGTVSSMPLWEQARRDYQAVEHIARAHGVKALVEIHPESLVPSASAARRFLDGFDPEAVGVIYDPGNMVWEGHEQYRFGLETLGPYLTHVHAKNSAWRQDGKRPDGSAAWEATWAPLDEGIVDLPHLFATLREVGYDGWVSVEDFATERPLEERVRENLRYLRGSLFP